jgi:pimeloyl-ACP methyl ester carboxylesterase
VTKIIPVLLLHGFGENQSIWDSTVDKLSEEVQILVFDLPGFGHNFTSASSIDEMANDVINQMDELHIETAIVIGHSMGGYVTVNLAARFKNRIKAIGFFHSNVLEDNLEKKTNRNQAIVHLKKYGTQEYLKSMAKSMLSPKNALNKNMLRLANEHLKDANVIGLVGALEAMRDRTNHLDFLSQTDIPILWIAGRNDSFMSVDSLAEQTWYCQRCMFVTLEHSGHLGMLEEPKEAQQILLNFFDWVYS